MTQLLNLSAKQVAKAVRLGELSAEAVSEAYLRQIDKHNGELNVFVHLDRHRVLEQARAIDLRRAQGRALGCLAGVPLGLKDNLWSTDFPTTCASHMLWDGEAGWTADEDATVVERLRAQDAVVMGKTNMDEFGMGASTRSSCFGSTANPWNTDCVAGGSSGGSAAAVTSAMACIALGSDTGGSVRQPAAFTQTVGLRPTYGRVSRFGLVAFASSLDQVGIVARNVSDCLDVLRVISGPDDRDLSVHRDPQVTTSLQGALEIQTPRPLTLGVVSESCEASEASQVALESFVEVMRREGHRIVPVSLTSIHYALSCYRVLAAAEARSTLARFDGASIGGAVVRSSDWMSELIEQRSSKLGREVKRRLMLGAFALSPEHLASMHHRALLGRQSVQRELLGLLAHVDLLVMPTTPSGPWSLRTAAEHEDEASTDRFTVLASLAGLPSMSIPGGLVGVGDMPTGIQLIAGAWRESQMLDTAGVWERSQGGQWELSVGPWRPE